MAHFGQAQYMLAFDASGNTRWIVPGNYQPQIATADGGVIATELDYYGNPMETVAFDQNGNATGQMASLPTYSWLGYAYQYGSVDQIEDALLDVALSFAPYRLISGNGTYVKLVMAKVFLPTEVADLSKGQVPLTAAFAKQFTSAAKSTIIAVEPFTFAKANAWRFLKALNTTNMIVAFVGHAITTTQDPPYHARGLAFGDGNSLQPGQVPLPNGFFPKAKVVFLGVCGIDPPPLGQFVTQWHLNQTYQQALIVPQYLNDNATNQRMDLPDAARDLGTFLNQLGAPPTASGFKGYNVGQAVGIVNFSPSNDGKLAHSWQVTPNGGNSVNFFATPAH